MWRKSIRIQSSFQKYREGYAQTMVNTGTMWSCCYPKAELHLLSKMIDSTEVSRTDQASFPEGRPTCPPESNRALQRSLLSPTRNPKPSTHSFQKSLFCNRRARAAAAAAAAVFVGSVVWVGRRGRRTPRYAGKRIPTRDLPTLYNCTCLFFSVDL